MLAKLRHPRLCLPCHRAYHNHHYRVRSNLTAQVAAAWAAGFTSVDVYMFPSYSGGDPQGQVQKAVSFLKSNNVKYGKFWIDVERTCLAIRGCYAPNVSQSRRTGARAPPTRSSCKTSSRRRSLSARASASTPPTPCT